MSRYAWVLFIGCLVPFIVGWFSPFSFIRHWRRYTVSIVPVVVLFGSWDILAVARKHWTFDPAGVWPVRIVTLPIEEILFFILIPMSCIILWESIVFITRKK